MPDAIRTTRSTPTSSPARLRAATDALETPYAVVDLAALRANAADLIRRSGGTPIRVASKSVRCREVMRRVLALPGVHGVLAFTLPEALWLAGEVDDVVVGYPSVDRAALGRLAADERLASRVTLMVDSPEHLEFTAAAVGPGGPPLRVCLELDASLRLAGGRVHVGARRSPVHTPGDAARLARAVVAHPRFTLVGVMAYEGQIAGIGDDRPGPSRFGVRAVQHVSARELAGRRAAAVAAVRAVAPLEFVNGGGTGSVELTAAEPAVTEVAAGSGLFAPALFDHYTRFTPRPAAYFVLSVVRRPSPRHATVLGGGWVASGPPGRDRLPTPVWPRGLGLLAAEGAGEVQTPLTGPGAAGLRIGDRVWFRHPKAGELCERVDALHLVDEDGGVTAAPTYRGEGHAFL
ncbi:amino acid deaminase/aldolase [Streptomyces chumphonensis]|uniref:amino acid deaminase/aldolase n=1 Tax=Streptomyces chumphonensis TaxID=1214925 RepID=UPI003D704BED